jgi:ubiquinone/menaquinone biosynthesis C-methylase UbiE
MNDPKRIVAQGYDRIGDRLRPWFDTTAGEARTWFLSEIWSRVPDASDVLELGCGAGVDAMELARGRRYTGVDLSEVMISLARERVPSGTFVKGDLTSIHFLPARSMGWSRSTSSGTFPPRSKFRRSVAPSNG